jgi:hypothetical protein
MLAAAWIENVAIEVPNRITFVDVGYSNEREIIRDT